MEFSNLTDQPHGGEVTVCPLFPHETWKCDTIMIFHRVSACLSLIGCTLVLFTMWLFCRYTIFHQRMILYISLCGGGGAVANIMGESPAKGICKIIAFINTFFDWGMLLWVVAVAVRICMAIFRRSKAGRFEWAYHYVIWPVSFTIALLPFFSNKYGNSGAWCWIVHDVGWRMGMYVLFYTVSFGQFAAASCRSMIPLSGTDDLDTRTWYGPMYFVIIALFFVYIGIVLKVRSMFNIWHRTFTPEVEESKKSLKGEVLPLVFYPLVYILLYIIPIVNRIHNAIHPDDPIFELVVLAAISATSLGAANSLTYGLDKETRRKLTWREIKNAWCSHFVPKMNMGEYSRESKSGDSQTEAKRAYSVTVSSGASQTEVKQHYTMEIYSVSAQYDGNAASDKTPQTQDSKSATRISH